MLAHLNNLKRVEPPLKIQGFYQNIDLARTDT